MSAGPGGRTADEEFREFMRGRWPAMVRLAYGLTGDLGHAEDVAQAAFARAYASWSRLARTGDPDAYLRQIVVNENKRRFRKRRVPECLPGILPDQAVTDAEDPDERAALLTALGRLAPRQRAVVVLRFWMDLSEAETAKALNCSIGTVKSQASRALAALRKDGGIRDHVTSDNWVTEGDVIEVGLNRGRTEVSDLRDKRPARGTRRGPADRHPGPAFDLPAPDQEAGLR